MPDLFTVPSALIERFTALGIDASRVLRDAGIAMSRFAGGKARLTTGEYLGLWRVLGAVAAPDFAWRLVADTALEKLDVSSMAALCSANLADALAKKARYKRLCCPEEITLDVRGDEAIVRFHWVLADGELPLLLVDATFASAIALARRGTGTQVAPRRVELARRRTPALAAALAKRYGCEVRFDAPIDLIVFDARVLAVPFVTHNEALLEMLAPGLEAALASETRTRARTLDDDVRVALRRRMCGERPSVDKLAAELRTSPRTLQRRLGELGTTYQALLDEVRRDSAKNLLTTTDLDIGEVAFVLGFEELNSFARAFHGWEGASPNQWRQARMAT